VNNETISGDEFRNKVIFYLWNDILRDELPETKLRVFPRKMLDDTETDFPVNFNDFFHTKYGWAYIEKMLTNLGLQPIN
jgi:fructose-1,6-bisphosphatase